MCINVRLLPRGTGLWIHILTDTSYAPFPSRYQYFTKALSVSTFPLLACRLPAGGSICSPDGASVVRVGRLQNRQLSDIACEKEEAEGESA